MDETLAYIVIWVGIGTVIANLLIIALVFKLYTEYWKDKKQDERFKK